MILEPSVTVIALCYNHAQFVEECLRSIAEQTVQHFQLVVTDDGSRDESGDLITAWLAKHRPDAVFIRHERNAGLCRTLNEALAVSSGSFISMIAADDTWESTKLERQLACASTISQDVAVVYSDAMRIDVSGNLIAGNFIDAAYPGCVPVSGDVFPLLANRNFIPAMATLIRRSALMAVGGYDERLTFEDYDMWLRLAAKWRFVFCEGTVARYRIVPTSMVRTLFRRPSANHSFTWFLIRQKWISSPLLTEVQREVWRTEMFGAAYSLYVAGDDRATACLWSAARHTLNIRATLLATASSLGLTRARAVRLRKVLSAMIRVSGRD